eukprot:CAMPEP_0204196428 /NCGR_PEP_ID=MMETSP0361-20130328/63816_1 /ASSEMBLY_ACC=CAM_ASM_000343 /TAXON_ID=268821 /ORGANISM="Scrippsiella Hangoei, Strain SHTV-5" /LENGTH=50 /DNA_ID=CAMNT_0051158175 /DNA_START=175 /DNA_END=327 /DNA_ORIENTATION=-
MTSRPDESLPCGRILRSVPSTKSDQELCAQSGGSTFTLWCSAAISAPGRI